MSSKTNIHIKPLGILDLLAFKNLIPLRRKMLMSGKLGVYDPYPPMNRLADALHPALQYMEVKEAIPLTDDIVSYTLIPDMARGTKACAYFKAGQYVSIKLEIDGLPISRPVTISSSPKEALDGYYTIAVKKTEAPFASAYIHTHWKPGSKVTVSGPEGNFVYEPLRDAPAVIGVAGGCGFTPFRSMARAIADGTENFSLVILYGSRRECDIAYKDEFDELSLKSNGKLRAVHVLSDETSVPESMETGFITADLIRKYAPAEPYSLFLCGPPVMYDFLRKELDSLGLEKKYVRRELYGERKNVQDLPDYSGSEKNAAFNLTVVVRGKERTVNASAKESLLTALERGGVAAPASCRSGECGFCRSRLIMGDVFIPEDTDGRRAADRKFGYVHPCASYPISDVVLEIPEPAVD